MLLRILMIVLSDKVIAGSGRKGVTIAGKGSDAFGLSAAGLQEYGRIFTILICVCRSG
jgi:hypothetical protein